MRSAPGAAGRQDGGARWQEGGAAGHLRWELESNPCPGWCSASACTVGWLSVSPPPSPPPADTTFSAASLAPLPPGGRPGLPQRHPAQRRAHQRGGAQARPRLPPLLGRHPAGKGEPVQGAEGQGRRRVGPGAGLMPRPRCHAALSCAGSLRARGMLASSNRLRPKHYCSGFTPSCY